jgi:hypothetical protein
VIVALGTVYVVWGSTYYAIAVMVETLPRIRRGASVLLITPSLDRAWVRPASTFRESSISTQAVLVGSEDTDERDRARRHALLGELAVAGVKTAHLLPDMNIEDLFHEAMNAIA